MHEDEIASDVALVRRLLAEQCPQWRYLSVDRVASTGTDNALYRLGADLVARLPLRPAAVPAIEREHRWLPELAPQLPLAVPVPVARGQPTPDFPWPWSVHPWLAGVDATSAPFDRGAAALDLARFVVALHAIDPTGGPAPSAANFGRGAPLASRDRDTRQGLALCHDVIDVGAATGAWDHAVATASWTGAPRWVHGDLAAGNLLVQERRISAVIDWEALAVGDPACDVMVAWELFDDHERAAFRAALDVDDATWARGRGWALSTAVIALPYYRDTNPFMVEQALRKIAAVLGDRVVTGIAETIAPRRLGPSFPWLLGSSWVSNLGDGMALAAGPLLVASQTDEPFLVASAVVLQRLPWVLFGLIAGVIADRHDRRRIVIGVGLARAVVLGVLGATIVMDQVGIAVVLVATFLLGVAETFADTTTQTLLPMLVDKRDLPIGNARLMAGMITVNQMVGPPVGAALFAVAMVLPVVGQLVCVLLAVSLVSKIALPPHGVAKDERSHLRRDIAEGMRWLWAHAAVRTLTLTIVTFNVTYGAAWSVLVLYAIETLDAGEVGFGLLATALAVGGIFGTAIYGWLSARASLGNIMRVGLILETLTHLALALTTNLAIALGIMFVFGAHAFIWGTTSMSVRQASVPTELQGRVSSVYLIGVQGGLVVGGAIGGVVAGAWGVTAPFWFAFAGSALLVVLIWPQLTHIAHARD